jgi:subtilisin family serine protease
VVVSAPGVNVVGDGPGGSYLTGSGTSPASAFVAGVAALIRSKYPKLSPGLVAQAIVSSTGRVPAGGYSPDVGFGEVDAAAALTAAGKLAAGPPSGAGDMAASGHFGGGASGAIVVVHRDGTAIAVLTLIAIVAAIGFFAAAAGLAVLLHRRRSQPSPPPAPPQPLPEPGALPEPAGQVLDNAARPPAPTAEERDDIS